MKKYILLALLASTAMARAQCVPSNAASGTMGCFPTITPPQMTDYVNIWRSSGYPNTAQGKVLISDLAALIGGGGGGGGGPFLPLSGGTMTGPIALSPDGLGLLGYNGTTGNVQLQNKTFAPLLGIALPDGQPITMSTDGTAIFSTDPLVHVFRFQNWPVEIDAGLTMPGGSVFSAGAVTAASGIVSGNPQGGNMGPGTINLPTGGYFQDGVLFNPNNVNAGTTNALAYYAANGSTLSPVAAGNNAVLVTDGSGNPTLSSTLPAGLTIPTPTISGTLTLGTANITGALSANSATITSMTVGANLFAGALQAPYVAAASGNITYNGAQTGGGAAGQYSFFSNANLLGTVTSGAANVNALVVSDDNVNMTANPTASNSVTWLNVFGNVGQSVWQPSTPYVFGQRRNNNGLIYQVSTAGTSASSGGPTGTGASITDGSVVWSYVGPDFSGSRAAIQGQLNILSGNDPATPNDAYRQWQSALFTTTIHANQGGTSLTGGNTRGAIFGSGDQSFAYPGATFLSGVIGHEADVAVSTGASSTQRVAYTAISFGDINASYEDAAYGIAAISGAPGFLGGILVAGSNVYPIASTGCLICYLPPLPGNLAGGGLTYANPTQANVLDLAGFEASGDIIRTNGGTKIHNNGSARIQSLSIATASNVVSLDPIGNILTSVAISAAGTGYKVNDHIYDPVTGTILSVASVDGSGAITGFNPLGTAGSVAGSYLTTTPTNPVSMLGGTGINASVNMTWTAGNVLQLVPSGGQVEIGTVGNMGPVSGNMYIHAATNKQLQFGNSTNGNGLLISDAGGSAVDYFNFTPGLATSNTVTMALSGADTNVGLTVLPQGTGAIRLGTSTSTPTSTGGDLTVNGNVHFQTTQVHFFFGTIASGANQLPTCNSTTNGSVTIIIDWNTQPAFGDNISTQTGGGSIRSLGLCDGTAWHAV